MNSNIGFNTIDITSSMILELVSINQELNDNEAQLATQLLADANQYKFNPDEYMPAILCEGAKHLGMKPHEMQFILENLIWDKNDPVMEKMLTTLLTYVKIKHADKIAEFRDQMKANHLDWDREAKSKIHMAQIKTKERYDFMRDKIMSRFNAKQQAMNDRFSILVNRVKRVLLTPLDQRLENDQAIVDLMDARGLISDDKTMVSLERLTFMKLDEQRELLNECLRVFGY